MDKKVKKKKGVTVTGITGVQPQGTDTKNKTGGPKSKLRTKKAAKESVVESVYHREISEDLGLGPRSLIADAFYPHGSGYSEPGESDFVLKGLPEFAEGFPTLDYDGESKDVPTSLGHMSTAADVLINVLSKASSKAEMEQEAEEPSELEQIEVEVGITGEEESSEEEDEEEEEYIPQAPPITPEKVETWEEKLYRFNQMISQNQSSTTEVSYIYDLRGLHSEPALEKPASERFRTQGGLGPKKKKGFKLRKKCFSMDDLLLVGAPYREQLIHPLETDEDFCHYLITRKMKAEWRQVFMKEKKRFSFFEELLARGHVLDSMEVPRNRNNLSYFVEAEKSALRKRIKYARLCFKTKDMYTGDLKNWYFHGFGVYRWVDGAVYEGQMHYGICHGEGKLTWPDGSIYEGQFYQGIRSGWGVFTSADGCTYAGDWVNNLAEGNGKMWYDPLKNDTDFYDGNWKQGLPNGFGIRVFANGDRYVGMYKFGLRDGKGSMVWLEERQVYKGQWENDIVNGRGQHFWYLERSDTSQFSTRHVYQGEWVNGVFEGIGRMLYPNGSWYEGHWAQGQRQGKGYLANSSGEMLVGLFRAGNIIGMTDSVTLHSPSYECSFDSLVSTLINKFGLLDFDMKADEKVLSRTVKRCLLQVRQLYERAGQLGHWWGTPGQHPDWLHKDHPDNNFSTRPNTPSFPQTSGHFGEGDGPNQTNHTKFISPDNVYPVTRIGLWLLMKDCPGILSAVTTAEFDNIWNSIDSISFQTRHNPFEPVYLWQFLQCLIVISTVLYIEIPRRRKKWKLGTEPSPSESSESLVNAAGAGVDAEPKIDNRNEPGEKSNSKPSEMDSILKLKVWGGEFEEEEMYGEEDILEFRLAFGETEGEGEGAEEASTAGGDHWRSVTVTPSLAEDVNHVPSIHKTGEGFSDQKSIDNQRRQSVPKKIQQTLGIGDAFEKLVREKLIPYLERDVGRHLPRIPTPLPSLSDLYKSFHSTFNNEDRDLITAVEYLCNVLPHKIHSVNQENPNYWNRSLESLATNVDLNFICNMYKESDEDVRVLESQQTELSGEFLGDKIKDTEIFIGEMREEVIKSRGHRLGSVEIYGSGNHVFGINENLETDKDTDITGPTGQNIEGGNGANYAPFSEKDLSPKPLLWKPKKNCIHVGRKDSVLKHLETQDVFKVFRYLYPNICGKSHEMNLEFDMTFCDWFWCTSLIAKICADREFYSALKDEPVTRPKTGRNGIQTAKYSHTHSAQKPDLRKAIAASRAQSHAMLPKRGESKFVNKHRHRHLTHITH